MTSEPIKPEAYLDVVMAAQIPSEEEDVVRSPSMVSDVTDVLMLKVINLRMQGYTYAEIGRGLEITPQRARTLFDRALAGAEKVHHETLIEKREIENQRLDRLQRVYFNRALQHDQKAFDNVLKIHDRRVRLNGLAAPTQVNLSVSIRAEMEAALSELEQVISDVVEAEIVEDIEDEEGTDDGDSGAV